MPWFPRWGWHAPVGAAQQFPSSGAKLGKQEQLITLNILFIYSFDSVENVLM